MPRKKAEEKTKGTKKKDKGQEDEWGALTEVVQGAIKEYGHSPLHSAEGADATIVPRAGTGIFGMDMTTGGGLPMGRVSMAYGPAAGGKTTLLMRATAAAQMLCANCYQPGEFERGVIELPDLKTGKRRKVETLVIKNCPCGKPKNLITLWVDAEHVWLPSWAKRNGVRPEKVILLRPDFGEQAYDIAIAMLNSGAVRLINIDSLAAMSPAKEIESSMTQELQGVGARMNNKFLRKIVSMMNTCENKFGTTPTLWLVNQYREKIGVFFGSPEVLPGGKGQGFSTTIEMEMRPGKQHIDKETNEPMFKDFKYVVKKNKVGVDGGRGEYRMSLQETQVWKIGDILEHEAVIKKAVEMALIDKPSQQMYEYGGESYRGISSLVRYFADNPDEYEKIKVTMLAMKMGVGNEEGEDD